MAKNICGVCFLFLNQEEMRERGGMCVCVSVCV